MSTEIQSPPERDVDGTQQRAEPTPRSTPPRAGHRHRRWTGVRVGEMVGISIVVVDLFLALDFVFRALSVGPDGFVTIVARVGNALARPFTGIFPADVYRLGHTTFWAALLALVVYTIAALIVLRILDVLSRPLRHSPSRA